MNLPDALTKLSEELAQEWDAGERSDLFSLTDMQEVLLRLADMVDPPTRKKSAVTTKSA